MHNHSVSGCFGVSSTSDHSNSSWTNVARPWFLLRIDPASEKLAITSLSPDVQWSPVGRKWTLCSYRLASQWPRSCFQWAPRCSAGVWWLVGRLLPRPAAFLAAFPLQRDDYAYINFMLCKRHDLSQWFSTFFEPGPTKCQAPPELLYAKSICFCSVTTLLTMWYKLWMHM